MKHHIRIILKGVRFICPVCEYKVTQKYNLYDHSRKVHKNPKFLAWPDEEQIIESINLCPVRRGPWSARPTGSCQASQPARVQKLEDGVRRSLGLGGPAGYQQRGYH